MPRAAVTTDDLKLTRDGWLWYGPRRENKWLRPVFEFIRVLPNGNVLTTDGGQGAIEWGDR